MYPEPTSDVFEDRENQQIQELEKTILPMQQDCLSCGDQFSIHSKEQLEKCSLVWNVKIHQLEYKLKLRALTK